MAFKRASEAAAEVKGRGQTQPRRENFQYAKLTGEWPPEYVLLIALGINKCIMC